jgi:hypothetical protein
MMQMSKLYSRILLVVLAVTSFHILLPAQTGKGIESVASVQGLRVSANHRYLIKQDGTPFFYLADTAWELFHRLSRGEIDYYLSNRADKGFTVIQATLLAEDNGLSVKNAEGELPLLNFDPATPNDKYFRLVDYTVDKAAADGLYMALLPTWGSWVDGKPHRIWEGRKVFNARNAYFYGLFLGKRYAAKPNIIWVLGGDRSPVGHMEIWDAMAKGLKEGDGGTHLITYHPGGATSSSQFLSKAPWLDFNMLQVGHYRFNGDDAEAVQHDYESQPTRPVVDGETTYEDMPLDTLPQNPRFTAYDVRKAAYWAVFAGAMGHTYGHNSVWQMYRKGDVPIDGARIEWIKALDAEGSFQMVHLRSLMESRPYLTRISDQGLILPDSRAIRRDSDRVQITRDGTFGKNDATYIFAYFPIRKLFDISTSVIPSSNLRAWWYDPRTGASFLIGVFKNQGDFSPKGNQLPRVSQGGPDGVLVIDDASKGYPPPGHVLESATAPVDSLHATAVAARDRSESRGSSPQSR